MSHWDEVVTSFGPKVFRIASRIVGNSADAEDLVQTAFLEAYQLQQKEAVRNWPSLLRRIVTHRAYDLLNEKRRRKAFGSEHEHNVAGGPQPIDEVVANELIERLEETVSRLPQQQASAFWLRYFGECSNDEIAESLGISSHAVAVALNKARTALAPEFCESKCGRKR